MLGYRKKEKRKKKLNLIDCYKHFVPYSFSSASYNFALEMVSSTIKRKLIRQKTTYYDYNFTINHSLIMPLGMLFLYK
jgi:hypothetical protein